MSRNLDKKAKSEGNKNENNTISGNRTNDTNANRFIGNTKFNY